MAKKKEPQKKPAKPVSDKKKKGPVSKGPAGKDSLGLNTRGHKAEFRSSSAVSTGSKQGVAQEPAQVQSSDLQNQKREVVLKEFFASDEELEAGGSVSLDVYQEQHEVTLRTAGVTEYLSFVLDDEIFAVNIFDIKEIIKVPPITVVPRTEPVILGILSLRGTIAPVVDLRRRLGLKAQPNTRKSRVLLVFLGLEMIGLLVDEVRHVVRLRDEDIEPPPGVFDRTEAEHILGVGRQHGEMYTLLDLNSVIQIDRYLKAI